MLWTRTTIVRLTGASLLTAIALGCPTGSVSTVAAPLNECQPEPRSLHPIHDAQRAERLLGSLGAVLTFQREELGLSDEQHAKLKALWIEYEKGRRQAEIRVQQAGMEAIKLSNDITADLESIESALIRFGAALASLQMQSIKTLRALRAVVPPQQLEKWENLVKLKMKQKESKGSA